MGSSSTQAPKQVTAANQIQDLRNQSANIAGMEGVMQPQMAGIGNTVEKNNAAAFQRQLSGATGQASGLAYLQNQSAINLLNQQGGRAGGAVLASNPWLQQLHDQGSAEFANSQTTSGLGNSAFNSGQGLIGNGQGMIGQGQTYLRNGMTNLNNSMNGSFVNNSNLTLARLNNTVNSELRSGGNVTQQEMNSVDQTTGSAFAQNGLFNSNLAAGADLLNRDQFSQNRLQQWMGIGGQVQGLNAQTQSNLMGAAESKAGMGLGEIGQGISQQQAGISQQQVGSSLQTASANQASQGINATNAAQGGLNAGINSLVNPNQTNTNIQSLMSGYNTSNVTPQYTNSLLGTTSSVNSTNAQGQYAANAANTQSQNAANNANTSMAAGAAVSAATIASSFN